MTAENGEAVFENFYDDEKLYNLVITDLIGYEDYSSTVPAVQNEIEYGEDMPSTIVKADENYLIDKEYFKA